MRELVLDASVVVKWFYPGAELYLAAARTLRAEYERGDLLVAAPPLLRLELLNVAARPRGFAPGGLREFVRRLEALRFRFREPQLGAVAHWAAQGLTAYDASYVALAEERRTTVITADEQMLRIAGPLAGALSEVVVN